MATSGMTNCRDNSRIVRCKKLYDGKLRAIRRISHREKRNIKFVGAIHELPVVKIHMTVNYGRFVGYRAVKKDSKS